jgi:hypothetical protein
MAGIGSVGSLQPAGTSLNEIETKSKNGTTRTKPFSVDHDVNRKQARDSVGPDQQWGSIMWSFILSLLYARSCEKYLANLARHRHGWL